MLLIALAMTLQTHEGLHHARRIVVSVSSSSIKKYLSGVSRKLHLETRSINEEELCLFKDMIARSPSTVYAVEFETERNESQPGYVGEQDLTQIPLDKVGPIILIEMPLSSREMRLRAKGRRFRLTTSFVYCGTSNLIDVVTPWYSSR